MTTEYIMDKSKLNTYKSR